MIEDPHRLFVVIPGCCGPALDRLATCYLSGPLPALERLLSRARFHPEPEVDANRLLGAFFHAPGADGRVPAAGPLSWLGDTGERPTGFIMRADPVHLRADQACLRLFDCTTFTLKADEARDLVSAFNGHFRAPGMRLHAPLPERWYLTLDQDPELVTAAPASLAGQDISDGLPRGKAAAQWHALLNEVQMLFHDHPVNQMREQRGEPAVNSIWPWGGGCLTARMTATVGQVYADSPTLHGLARLAAIPARELPRNAAELVEHAGDGPALVWLDPLERATCYGEVEAWADGLRQLEPRWFRPLKELLEQGRIGNLVLHLPGVGRYEINRRRLRAFWKPDRSLARHCGQA